MPGIIRQAVIAIAEAERASAGVSRIPVIYPLLVSAQGAPHGFYADRQGCRPMLTLPTCLTLSTAGQSTWAIGSGAQYSRIFSDLFTLLRRSKYKTRQLR
jgi:hypothetical protein